MENLEPRRFAGGICEKSGVPQSSGRQRFYKWYFMIRFSVMVGVTDSWCTWWGSENLEVNWSTQSSA
jgi:hypothetical protein